MGGKLKTIISLVVGALFVYLFARNLNLGDVWQRVRAANWAQLGLAVALLIGTYFVRTLRWRTLLKPMARPPLKALFRATMIGFSALFLMGRAAEMIIRPAALSIKERVHPSASYATVMIERVFDMVMVVLFFAVNLVFFEYNEREHDADAMRLFGWIKVTGGLLLVAAAVGVYGLSVFRRRREAALTSLEKKLNRLPSKISRALMSLLHHISEALAVLHDARSLTITLSYTALLWLMVATAHLLVVRAFGIHYDQVPFTGAVFVMGLSMLGSVVPTPGGATGPFHIATAASLAFLGIDQDVAKSVAIILHPLIFAPATLFGMFYVAREGLSLGRLKHLAESRAQEDDQAVGKKEEGEQEKRWPLTAESKSIKAGR
ncbi:MAG TPA: lysylphosphatidylglycerol synthase transmembrane domain-containing protein [Blastocatellia bacterium]|nr:lysylphosphatidylglycerol synthase transmembrane domain-containing protein [Blastocatellia bacterium]